MVDDLHSHFTGRYLPYGVWSERQLCGTHDGCTSTNRYSGYDLCAESAGSAQTATQSVTASSGKLLYLSIMREIDSLLVAPTTRSTSFPPLNRIKVGMPLIPYVAAVDGLSSTFSFTTKNARIFLRLPPPLLFTSPRCQALRAQFFSRLQKLVAESRAGHCLGQRERAVHQGEQGDCLFAAFASSINHLGE